MPLKQFTIDFREFTTHQYLRFDEKFWFTTKNLAVYDYILLKDIFYLINGNSYTEYYTEEKTDIPYIRIGDLSFKYEIDDKNLIYLDDSCKINEDKKLRKDDLILATIGATIGKINLAREFENGTFSNNTILLRLKDKENHNPYFYEKLFQSDLLQKYIWGVVSQKAQPNLQTYDLQKIKIPVILKSKQDQIVAEIEPIEKKIKALKSQITPPQEIINKVFTREFGFDLEKFEEFKKEKFFEVYFSNFANHKDKRFGIGIRKANIDLKPFISKSFEYVRLGKIVSLEYGSGLIDQQRIEGDYPVMGANGIVGYHNQYLIEGPSIIVGRKGSAGEVNYIEENNYPIDTCFYVKFLQEQNIIYFSYLLKFLQLKRLTLFKGVPGLNRYDVYDVKIPNISLKSQQKIVDEIKAELDKQEEMKKKIEAQRNKIDEIIEKAIS